MATFEITQGDKTFSVDVPEGVDANAVLAQFPEASAVLKQFPPGSPPPAPLGDAVIDEPSEAPGRTIPEQIARGTGLGLRTVAGVIPKTATGIADLAAMALNVPIAGLDKLGQLLGDEPLDVRLPTGATASLDEALSQIFPTPETLGEKIAVGTGEVALTGGAGAAALAPKLGAVTKNPAVQSIIRNLGDEIGAFFAKSPKTAGALEATSGVGAVGAGELAEEAELSPTQQFISTLVGGATGAIAPQAAVTTGRRLITKGAETFAPFTRTGGEIRAARQLQGAAESPKAAAKAAAEAPEGVLPARATEDPNLRAIESKVLADDPQLAGKVAADLEVVEKRTLTDLADQFGPGTNKQDFQQAVIERGAAPGVKIKAGQPDEMLDDAAKSFNKAYAEVEGFPVKLESLQVEGGNVPIRRLMSSATSDTTIIADKKWRKGIREFLSGLVDDVARRDIATVTEPVVTVDSADLLQMRQTIRQELRRRTKAGRTSARAAAEADMLSNANKAVTEVLESQLPETASASLRATDARYGDFITVQGAVLRSGEKGLTPEALRASVKASAASPGQFARGKGGDLARLAEQGKDVAAVLGKPDQAGRIVRDMTPEQLQTVKADFNKAVAGKATNTKGRLSGEDYLAQIEKNTETLKAAGFTDTELSNMKTIGRELKMIQSRSPAAVEALLNDNTGRLVRLLGAVAGSRAGTRVLKAFGGGGGAGPSLILAQFGSREMRKVLTNLSVDTADKIIREAATNKKLFAALMTKPIDPIAKQAQAARTIQAFLLEPAKQASETEAE